MGRVQDALREIHQVDGKKQNNTIYAEIHPSASLLLTIWYLVVVVSFGKYDVSGLLGMILYLVIVYNLGEISIGGAWSRLKGIWLLLFFFGIANLVVDRHVLLYWGGIPVTGGMLSFVTLYIKGVLAILASYALISTTGVQRVCYAMQCMHVPKIFVTVVLLIYRYLILFMKEVERISLAYAMRAPGQKGIHIRAWGSLLGAMLLRSIDRSEIVYESMQLRGFCGEFSLPEEKQIRKGISWAYGIIVAVGIMLLRIHPILR